MRYELNRVSQAGMSTAYSGDSEEAGPPGVAVWAEK